MKYRDSIGRRVQCSTSAPVPNQMSKPASQPSSQSLTPSCPLAHALPRDFAVDPDSMALPAAEALVSAVSVPAAARAQRHGSTSSSAVRRQHMPSRPLRRASASKMRGNAIDAAALANRIAQLSTRPPTDLQRLREHADGRRLTALQLLATASSSADCTTSSSDAAIATTGLPLLHDWIAPAQQPAIKGAAEATQAPAHAAPSAKERMDAIKERIRRKQQSAVDQTCLPSAAVD